MNKTTAFLTLSILAFTGACQDKNQDGGHGYTGQVEAYPMLSIQKEKANIYSDYPVVLQGVKDVELRPKIDGFIESILVDEGQSVRKGQVLFTIYAPQFQEENASAIANVKRAEAELNDAIMQVAKAKPLVQEGIISNYELESAQYALRSKEAQLAQAKANLSNAKANVGYTQIVAPFDGVIGLIPYKVGALVSSASAQALTTISDITSVNAYFSMNEKQFFDFMQKAQDKSLSERIASLPEVSLILANGGEYGYKGKINTVSGQIDPLTGSINFRAVFSNPKALLRSGNSATLRVYEDIQEAILVPQKATYDVQGKRFVYVVGADGIVKSTEIKIMDKVPSSQFFIVEDGLKQGDKIVSEDIGGLSDGTQIKL
ncbi:efflux RND transporter periplasmic adaptor subunit [Myroides albus]|uniref:efflux RND transporter periplasmic adaptor subunit n=1 Tax=Myroides albus TaxID=2562892 RepID=UPI002158C90C|nr:efflux RND transporter periplasmic adaptor subunit [Myroides albus]UVD78961.1 efflux RND transporter periplasmic adaptor subunit [Myroides albus]